MTEIDVAVLIRDVNATNHAVEDQCLRARQAADAAIRSLYLCRAKERKNLLHRVPDDPGRGRRPPRRRPGRGDTRPPRAHSIIRDVEDFRVSGPQRRHTLIWTVLFLAVLAGGEIGLDFYRDRNLRAWRILTCTTSAFVVLLGVLRFWFLATIGTGDLVAAFTGAALFTVVTAGFLTVGYRTLRAAETRRPGAPAGRLTRPCRPRGRPGTTAKRDAAERDRLIDAYLRHVRKVVLRTCAVDQQLALEGAVRDHLCGRCT